MDLFGFNNNDTANPIENQIMIEMALKKYRRSLWGMIFLFTLIIVIIGAIFLPFYIEDRVNERVSELELEIDRQNYLPANYTMIGVEVGYQTIDSVLEIRCSTPQYGSSAGSGFIITNDGYIITNAHVVTYEREGMFTTTLHNHSTIRSVFYNSDTQYTMDVIARDINKDIAILKFRNPPSELHPVKFGNSEMLNMGEEVVAIGNAQGLGLAITVGVVSDPKKSIEGVDSIQTDAAINPGNSGGPLLNAYSELMGMTTFKIVNTEANEGMGFAIPSNTITDYIDSIYYDIDYIVSDNYQS